MSRFGCPSTRFFALACALTTRSRFVSSLFSAMLLAVVLLSGIQSALSQTSNNRTEFTPDKTLKSNARINPTSLAMEFSIPLPSYPGRAGSGLPHAINYSSKVWGSSVPSMYTSTSGTHQQITAQYGKGSWSGWTSTLGVPQIDLIVEAYTETGYSWTYDTTWDPDPSEDFNLTYVKKMRVIMPDGSVHELRADDGYHPYGTALNPGNGVSDSDFYSGTFLSVDGSRLRLEFPSQNFASNVLYMPDGSRYVGLPGWSTTVVAGTTTYYDVHGNKMTYVVSTSGSITATWTDTMGRSLSDPLPRAGLSVQPTAAATPTFNYPTRTSGGSSPAAQNIQYKWETLSTQQGTLSHVTNVTCSGGTTTPIPSGTPYLFSSAGTNPRVCPGQSGSFNPVVLTELTLPNGAKYTFQYNIYGEITRINYPTGGYERFVYAQATPVAAVGTLDYDQFNRIVTDRYISEDGSTEVHWQYAVNTSGAYSVRTYAPDGSWSEQFLQYSQTLTSLGTWGYNTMTPARVYETRVYKDTTYNTLLRRTLSSTTQTGPLSGGVTWAYRDIRPEREIEMIFEPDSGSSSALITMTEHFYDTTGSSDPQYFSSLNEKQTKSYKYVVQSASTAASANISTAAAWFSSSDISVITETDFLYDSNYKARNLNSLPTETRVKDPSGNVKAKTQFTYDESSYITSTSGTMPSAASGSWVDPTGSGTGGLGSTIGSKRGLPTSIRRFHDIANSYYIDTRNFFDQYGNPTKVRDGRGNDTSTAFADTYAFAYPTEVTTPIPDSTGVQGWNQSLKTITEYDYNTGLTIKVKDPNESTTDPLVTEYEYVDDLLRVTKITPKKNSGAVGARTEMEYGAPSSGVYSSSQRFVKTKTQIDSTYWKESIAWADGLGRAFRSQEVKSGDDVYAVTCFDNMGRVQKTSNPIAASTAPTCSSSLDWTTPAYDKLGRTVSTTTPDSAVAYIAYGLSTSAPIGTTVTATDQASKKRKSITDTRGNLVRIVEDPDTLAYNTDYTYDPLKNLTTVSQGSQTRTFDYDALSRLKSAINPESGTTTYTYDANSNLATKVDARSITTTYSYDLLNRVKQRSYSDSTPTATYYYDLVSNAKGKLVKVSNSNSITEYTSFDPLGRITGHKQTTGGNNYATAYSYYLNGAIYEETYPSGRVVRSSLNTDGQLSQVETKPSGGSFTNRASNFTYTAAGAASSLQLGNGLYETTTFNSRLQPTEIRLGTTNGGTDRLSLALTYGSGNNGNVLTQTITVPSQFTATQTYTYDALNRIGTASETIGSPTWSQTYGYDQYGNKNITAGTGTTSLTFGGSTNRITTSGYSYDNAGNTTADPSGKSFTYDAENKQTAVTNGGTLGNYAYDGDGRRIKKYNTSTSDDVFFVYDATGKLIEERDLSSNLQTSYIHAGSRLLSTETSGPTTNYLTTDHLGSPRVTTNGSGSVSARHDYTPFGVDILTPPRSTSPDYVGDMVRQKFTAYERDQESSLDFARARMFESSVGRFTVPDPLGGAADTKNPQTFNKYTYVGNNPMRFSDPSGLIWYYRRESDGSTTYRWYNENERVEAGFHQYLGPLSIDLGNGTALHLNPLGWSRNGKSDWERRGWIIGDSQPNFVDAGDPIYNPASPRYVSGKGVEDVSLELYLTIQAGASLVKQGIARLAAPGLGDLTAAEVRQIQAVVNKAERPLEVVGSAARGIRRNPGTNNPIGKGPGTRSDIDYVVPHGSIQHYEAGNLHRQLPSIDSGGIVGGTHNPFMGPAIRFEPRTNPVFIPQINW